MANMGPKTARSSHFTGVGMPLHRTETGALGVKSPSLFRANPNMNKKVVFDT